ncbi:hypothetical protein [Paenibacillus sp. IHBB 3054]|uniref:hypothetical protein n=1 Tax=Paenibacillus sp. IHBB 3054 TaxID=3425689 RepID=UPI003F6816D5
MDITKRSALLQGMDRIKVIVITVAAAYLIAAFTLSFFLSIRLYRPLPSRSEGRKILPTACR